MKRKKEEKPKIQDPTNPCMLGNFKQYAIKYKSYCHQYLDRNAYLYGTRYIVDQRWVHISLSTSMSCSFEKKRNSQEKNLGSNPGFEPGTSCTQSRNHASRPIGHSRRY